MVIDGHSLAFRAFFALPVDSFVNSEGQHTNAIHGFVSMLLNLLQNENPSHIAVAFDISRSSFRTREYPEYKAGRDATPVEFKGQIPLLRDALHAMGIKTVVKEDFEADDILATLARQGREQGFKVLVVSGDRDSIQLVTDDVTLLYPSTQGVTKLTRYDPAKVEERYSVRPEQYPDVAALVGEKSDNLPGVPKVGEKTAAKWLAQYGSLQGILDHADEIGGKVGESFREHRENAVRNRKLNRLVDDVELPVAPDQLTRGSIDADAVREIFTKLQFRTLQDRVLKLADEAGDDIAPAEAVAAPVRPELLDEELEQWLEKAVAATPEGLGLAVSHNAEGGIIAIGVSTAAEATELRWIPERVDYAPLEAWLASDAPKLMFDAKPQLKALTVAGLAVGGQVKDGQLAAWLYRPQNAPKRLAELVQMRLDEQLPEGDPNQLQLGDESSLVASDAWYTQRATTAALGMLEPGTLDVFTSIETPLLATLSSMELQGVAIDRDFLQGLADDLTERIRTYEQEAFDAIGGTEINLGSPKQLQVVLFETLEMPKTRKTKTGFSTDAESLADLERNSPHPFLGALRKHRDSVKLRQIMESLLKAIDESSRIHTSYHQIGSATGRLSSNDPNLQNIPIRSDEGRRIRRAFVHGPEFESLLTADYSQIEMRIMAHLSGDAALIEAFNAGEDLHRFVGSRVFGVDPADVTPAMRSKVKAMSYGLAYGLSAFGLSKQLQIEVAEAKKLMIDYFERFGKVRDYLRNVVLQAKEDGYTETIFGRRRPFPDLHSTNRIARENAERQALNSPIQGSAADIIKRAMNSIEDRIRAENFSSRMLLQVHDELVFEVAAGEGEAMEALVREEMAAAADLTVPLEVQIGRGPNWDEAAH
ncbi:MULTISPECIES: DNA polymerase I [unclassified Pseudoclavibacter]|uniref:DNA polymerase I n=1 Tax=unclassified Pseudoclavibacter TaxID=2615177 RepID=UPI000CE743B2|nr:MULTISPECIES: DNA polymerase I [unclassified Pseudoclavibacter]MBS3177996.1 DNA polymerase I [Pseudoclavibacter sp. Marseille-Q4354]PPG29339.1 DNA polymerase I [Pseudoclavibacter sp. RFBB5]